MEQTKIKEINQAYLNDDPELAEELEIKKLYEQYGGNVKDIEKVLKKYPMLIEVCIELGKRRRK